VTEEDLVVAPSEYWEETLKAAVKDMLQMKKKRYQRVRSEGTAIMMKTNDRSQKNIEKFCNSTNIDWKLVEKQLRKWSNLLCIGKKLTIVIVFNYRSEDNDHSATALTRVDKRGCVSVISRMLAEREAYIANKEERTGRTAT
jgi:hypothetical protein